MKTQDLIKRADVIEARQSAMIETATFDDDFEVEDRTEYKTAASILKQVKAQAKVAEAEMKELTDPLKGVTKAIEAKFKPFLTWCKETEAVLKRAIVDFHTVAPERQRSLLADGQDAEIVKSQTAPDIVGLSFTETWDPIVEDVDALPREFVTVKADMKAIRAAIKEAGGDPSIPGLRVDIKKGLTVRS